MIFLGAGMSSRARGRVWGLVQLGALAEGAGGAGEGAGVEPVEVAAHVVPGLAGGGLDDADEQQREPAQQDVGADAFFEAVVDRAQVEDLLHVPPAAFDLEELLVAQRDVGGGAGAGPSSAAGTSRRGWPRPCILALSMRSSPPGVTRRYRFRPGLVEIFPRSSPRFITGRRVGAGDQLGRAGRPAARGCAASRVAASGLWQITNRSVSDTFTSLTRMFSRDRRCSGPGGTARP